MSAHLYGPVNYHVGKPQGLGDPRQVGTHGHEEVGPRRKAGVESAGGCG